MAHERSTGEYPFVTSKDGRTMNSVTAYGLDTFDQEAGRGFEEPKVALKRKIPASELFVHFIAVGAIVFLGWACVRQKYWKDLDFKNNSWLNVYLRAWQLGAKAHELFMIASLSFIVFYHTRRLLIGPNGIPFGLLISPFTSNSPGMLFHRYFWNAVTRNRTFGVLLGFVCIFSVIIGPSSAITMIPSLNWFQLSEAELPGEIGWPNGGESIHFLAEPDLLWPTTLNASKDLESTKDTPQACASQPFDYDLFLGCPVSGFATILKWFSGTLFTQMGESLIFTDDWSKAKREMSIHTIPRAEGYPTAVYASVMTSLTLSSLGTFYNYARSKDLHKINDIPYPRLRVAADTPTYQPLVHVNCHDTVFGGDWDRVDIEFPGLQSAWMDDSEYVQDPYILAADSQIFDSLSNNETRFSWLKDTREDSSSSLLAVAIYPTATKNDTHEIYQGWIVVACSVDARWAANTAMYQPKNGTLAISNISNSVLETLGQQNSEDSKEKRTNLGISEKPVDIPLDWGSLLNGNHSVTLDEGDGNVTTFPAMEYILSMTQDSYDNSSNITTFLSLNTTDSSLSDEIVGTTSILLGAILADGIANTGASAGSWYAAENTNKTVNKRYKATFLSIFTNYYYTDELPGYSIRIEADRYGYGWTLRAGKTFFFAISCLLFYAMVVFFHIGFIIFDILTNRYLYGECWENVGDLIALATNSRPTPRLYGTSAGIDRRETWRDIVKVRECEENHLELCFVSDARDEMGQSLRRDKAYH